MPGDNDTALHGTRVQPVRVITLACARDYGPKRCAAGAFSLAVALMSFELTKKSTLRNLFEGFPFWNTSERKTVKSLAPCGIKVRVLARTLR